MKIYHHQTDIKNGFLIIKQPSCGFSPSHGHNLFEMEYNKSKNIKCWGCGIEADCWVADKHRNDLIGKPVLNPYALKQNLLIMMNRDHIIPRSLGGLNVLENLRVACETCNSNRGNHLTKEDKQFIKNNMHLFSQEEFNKSRLKMELAIKTRFYTKSIQVKMRRPYKEIDKILLRKPKITTIMG